MPAPGRTVLSRTQAWHRLPEPHSTLEIVPVRGREHGIALPKGSLAAMTLQSPTAEDEAAERVPRGSL